jgi:hypothetical protein
MQKPQNFIKSLSGKKQRFPAPIFFRIDVTNGVI